MSKSDKLKIVKRLLRPVGSIFLLLFLVLNLTAGEKVLIELKDFTKTELKSAGFILSADAELHIVAKGGAGKKSISPEGGMYAYAWIIDGTSRELVWKMDRKNTSRDGEYRNFDDILFLKKGIYEVYFTAYGYVGSSIFSDFILNIDHRKLDKKESDKKRFFTWLEDLFGDDSKKDWKKLAKNWGITISISEKANDISLFKTPNRFGGILYSRVEVGDNERIRQSFSLSKSLKIRIYSLGEKDLEDEFADNGWIVDMKTGKKVWKMQRSSREYAGGDKKNIKFDGTITLPAGDYTIYYNTDNSHSFADWNAAPPHDPMYYGITIMAVYSAEMNYISLIEKRKSEENVVVQLIRMKNDEIRSTDFTLKNDAALRIYAIGERSYSRRQMADYGWIINSVTREKIWAMDPSQTDHAGGANKNRVADEVVKLPKGSYTVFFKTDNSHAYDDWNEDPPFDEEHYGISIYADEKTIKQNIIEKNETPKMSGVIAQIVGVGDNANQKKNFHLDKTTRIRIYALGEGENRKMYDYGWIENKSNGTVIWEMTYSMTLHAGGGRKNRSVSTNIVLEKGDYILHYVSDGSHSYERWNTDPPDDITMWGITLYEEK